MVSYDFYKNTYLGSALRESDFHQAIARAEDWLNMLERTYTVTAPGNDSRKMALCAMAETVEGFSRRQFVSQASVGGVSVRYATGDRALQRQLLRNAGIFLDIRRGVS